ncbi:protein CUP-SHAPED COTYLEDON 2-like [Durio zibethinus]|uniref:Protein CUP-SHAPED COTYLEDON 2-like n=1 Tax=Durio zibethinus TaxID=66656 RepID=A0A6P5WID9_DURZI|nr:protein CUP-SHAPED COTYLEDON 2-like [Durio zibethinus]
MEDQDDDFGDQYLPVGYRFVPTDEELVSHYLINRVFCKPVPASVFQEINASELYSQPPKSSVQFSSGEREWFFFIHKDGNFDDEQHKTLFRMVGDGLGFWRSNGEKPLFDTSGNVVAFKIHLTYFSGCLSKAKKTHWRMDEYRLPIQFYTLHNSKEEWALGRLTRGRDYNFDF